MYNDPKVDLSSSGETSKRVIRVLVVDDEPDILEIIEYNLSREGYEVYTCNNGQDAILKAKEIIPDLIILDIMMPKMDGIETCKELRKIEKLQGVYIVFLTARSEEFLEIAGFNAGADDYIAKPIKPKSLKSRIEAILRRTSSKTEQSILRIEIGDLIIDGETRQVFQNGVEKVLAKKEFQLLYLLASKPGKVFSRETILESVWGSDVVVVNRTIDVHVRKLREKLGDSIITTLKGVGYKLEPLESSDEKS